MDEKSSTGMDAKAAAGLSVLLAVIGISIAPLVFFFIEKDSQFVKFHSMQALVLSVAMWVCYVAGIFLAFIFVGFLLWPIAFVIWVFMVIQCIKAFQGERYMVPFFGKLAAQWVGQASS
jgi:uncharacterized membrane protein